MSLQPRFIPFVSVEVVYDDVDFLVGIGSDDPVHEGKEVDPPAMLLVGGGDLAGGHIEGSKQCGGAVPLVIVAVAAQRAAIRQLEISLGPLQRLDRWVLIDAHDNCVLRWRHVEANHLSGLGGKLGIIALTPRLAAVEVDPLLAQKTPNPLLMDIAEIGGNQFSGPACKASRRRPFQYRQDA